MRWTRFGGRYSPRSDSLKRSGGFGACSATSFATPTTAARARRHPASSRSSIPRPAAAARRGGASIARRRRSPSVHQLPGQVDHLQRAGVGGLLEVGARRVAAFGILVIEEGEAHLLHPGGELSCVLRADAVVLGGGEDE